MHLKSKDVSQTPPWESHDTLLLDMDGTILDLAFDDYFWRDLVPRCFSRQHGVSATEAEAQVFSSYSGKEGTLDWYCLDYWSNHLNLNLVALKSASSQRISFLPGARDFLVAARHHGMRIILVTNAHRDSLQIKAGVVGLWNWFDELVSSHDYGRPKEHREFWVALEDSLGLDPGKTLFVDDSLPVLDSALGYGIKSVVAVRHPNSLKLAKDVQEHFYVDRVGQWVKAV